MCPHVYTYIYTCMCHRSCTGAAVASMCYAMHSFVTPHAKPELPPLVTAADRERATPLRVLTPLDYPSHLGVYSLANLPRDGLWQRQREH